MQASTGSELIKNLVVTAPSSVDQVGPANPKNIPNVPAQSQFCSAYRDGTGAGDALYQICMNFPNIPSQKWASCVRGKLMSQYVRNGNPIDLSWYLLVNHPVDFLSCPVK